MNSDDTKPGEGFLLEACVKLQREFREFLNDLKEYYFFKSIGILRRATLTFCGVLFSGFVSITTFLISLVGFWHQWFNENQVSLEYLPFLGLSLLFAGIFYYLLKESHWMKLIEVESKKKKALSQLDLNQINQIVKQAIEESQSRKLKTREPQNEAPFTNPNVSNLG